VGFVVGVKVVGAKVGVLVVGAMVGTRVGFVVGVKVVGAKVGVLVVGAMVGTRVGFVVGVKVVGAKVGTRVGVLVVGTWVGFVVGVRVVGGLVGWAEGTMAASLVASFSKPFVGLLGVTATEIGGRMMRVLQHCARVERAHLSGKGNPKSGSRRQPGHGKTWRRRSPTDTGGSKVCVRTLQATECFVCDAEPPEDRWNGVNVPVIGGKMRLHQIIAYAAYY